MNKFFALGAVAFGVTLAVLIGERLSDQAMAVIVGSVIGVAASVPMTALVLWLSLRQGIVRHNANAMRSEYAPREEPRTIVIQPQAYPPAHWVPPVQPNYLPMSPAIAPYTRPMREFKIVGQEDFDDEDRNALV